MLNLLKALTRRAKKTKCPECEGHERYSYTNEAKNERTQTRDAIRACPRCGGKGYVTAENEHWIQLGKRIKKTRQSRGMTQTEFAHRYGGLKTAELVALESGYKNPSQFIDFLKSNGVTLEE